MSADDIHTKTRKMALFTARNRFNNRQMGYFQQWLTANKHD